MIVFPLWFMTLLSNSLPFFDISSGLTGFLYFHNASSVIFLDIYFWIRIYIQFMTTKMSIYKPIIFRSASGDTPGTFHIYQSNIKVISKWWQSDNKVLYRTLISISHLYNINNICIFVLRYVNGVSRVCWRKLVVASL